MYMYIYIYIYIYTQIYLLPISASLGYLQLSFSKCLLMLRICLLPNSICSQGFHQTNVCIFSAEHRCQPLPAATTPTHTATPNLSTRISLRPICGLRLWISEGLTQASS